MKKIFLKTVLVPILILAFHGAAFCADFQIDGLKIKFIRYVGAYSDPQFNDTIELWFTTPLTFPASSSCTATYRVYIDAKHRHLVAGAQLALALDRPVNIVVDNNLPIRSGSCEVVYFDVPAVQ
ncbi:hypothetical protein [Massilia phyllosphaerae]|uniref:hypothetical protein n=1 Tax=Massilia phyllosphaerae TaxID=3106034 RepID=UPI002B1CD3C7|nr:hypothetical protein [Massilia sp. SGZ-792]